MIFTMFEVLTTEKSNIR